ncbi:MAG: cytochrome c3 family protein [Bryobacterales bacterium]
MHLRLALAAALLLVLPGLAQQVAEYVSPPEELPREVAAQLIPFNHKLHVDKGVECLDCHKGAEKKRAAGLPDMKDCFVCHQTIAADSPDIQKMAMLFNGGVRLDWVRVYQTPDFVFFSHKNHVKAGLSCEQCHGPVATREVLAQEVSTNMTACMNCHKERGATTECFFCHELGQ